VLNGSDNLPTPARAVLSMALPFRRGGAAAGLPQRIKILGWGENLGRTTGAKILVDEHVAQTLSSNQELVAIERVPMDYEHQSVKGHPNYLADPRHSPGSGTIEVVAGEGVYLSNITYTSNGETHAGDYLDVSGVVHLDKAGRPLWVSSVALTQTGDVAGMEFSEAVAALSARRVSLSKTEPNTMTDSNATFRPILLKLLKLPDNATDEDIIVAGEKESAEETTETMTTDETETATLSARLDALEAIHTSQCRQALVDQACREGKAIPLSAELIATTPVAVLAAMVAGLPANVVPMQTTTSKEVPSEQTAVLSADEKGAAKRLGLTDEEYLKGKH
jgi:phage I-like protein